MQAIKTMYKGPTNTRDSRIRACLAVLRCRAMSDIRNKAAVTYALDALNAARDTWLEACTSRGLDPYAQSSAMLSIGAEFLPTCAQRALKGGSMPCAVETELYVWLAKRLAEGCNNV